MNNVRSEIIFNRALLWLVAANVTQNKIVGIMFLACSVVNLVKSYQVWEG